MSAVRFLSILLAVVAIGHVPSLAAKHSDDNSAEAIVASVNKNPASTWKVSWAEKKKNISNINYILAKKRRGLTLSLQKSQNVFRKNQTYFSSIYLMRPYDFRTSHFHGHFQTLPGFLNRTNHLVSLPRIDQ